MTESRVDEPGGLHPAWAERFNAKDVAGMLALAEPSSAFVPQPGTQVIGNDVAGALQQFLDLGLPIDMSVRHVIRAGDIACSSSTGACGALGPTGTRSI